MQNLAMRLDFHYEKMTQLVLSISGLQHFAMSLVLLCLVIVEITMCKISEIP